MRAALAVVAAVVATTVVAALARAAGVDLERIGQGFGIGFGQAVAEQAEDVKGCNGASR